MTSLLSALLRFCPKTVRNSVRGKLSWQPFFERLCELALVGMNYEEGFLIEISGELDLLARIHATHTEGQSWLILDVGANVGHYTQAVLATFGGRFRVHAFEPSAVTAERFHLNIGPDNRVCLHRRALADTAGVLKLYTDSDGSPVATLNPDSLRGTHGHDQSVEEVQTEPLDGFCNDSRAFPYEVFRTVNFYARLRRLPPLPVGPLGRS